MTALGKAVFPVAAFGTHLLLAIKAKTEELFLTVHKPSVQYAEEEVVEVGEPDIYIHGVVVQNGSGSGSGIMGPKGETRRGISFGR